MFNIGFSELLLILLVAFVVVGPKDLPKVAGALGRGLRSVKKMYNDFKEESGLIEVEKDFRKAAGELEKTVRENDPTQELRKAREDFKAAVDESIEEANRVFAPSDPQEKER